MPYIILESKMSLPQEFEKGHVERESFDGTTPIPDYLTRGEVQDDPLPRLKRLIEIKITNLHRFNRKGVSLMDSQIENAFDSTIDLGLSEEAIGEMRYYSKGKKLSKEGVDRKDRLEKQEREGSPVLKLSQLIINKIAGMNDLSDEELRKLDESIIEAYRDARSVEISKADTLMSEYFMDGRSLTKSARDWISQANDEQDVLYVIIEEEKHKLAIKA